jgi:hypothetical protein
VEAITAQDVEVVAEAATAGAALLDVPSRTVESHVGEQLGVRNRGAAAARDTGNHARGTLTAPGVPWYRR